MKNITRLLISDVMDLPVIKENNIPLNKVVDKYMQFYRESSPVYLDEPIVLIYDAKILTMTTNYYKTLKK